jgi:hypothetical protein
MLVNWLDSFDNFGRREGTAEICGRLAKSLQSALGVDGAIIYLGGHAERRRLADLSQLCRSAGAFARIDAASISEDNLRCLSDPLTAYERGVGYFACSPIIGADELPLGKVAVFSYRTRELPVDHLDLIRAAARTIQDILRVTSH